MDINKAKEIISALAEGIDPTTGEVLPDDSVCNKGEVVRAFYAVINAFEDKKVTAKTNNKEPDDYDAALYEKLRMLRSKVALEKRKASFMILTDATLKHLAEQKPLTKESFMKIYGIGDCKSRQYSEMFINEIKEYLLNSKCN